MGRLRKLSQLSAQDWMVLGQAWVLFLVIELGLRLLSFRSLLNLCRRWSRPRHASPGPALPAVERYAWLTDIAGRYAFVGSTCLKRALVLSILLERQGRATTLRIGVSRETGSLKAHAWLEQDEQIIFGSPEGAKYEPLLPSFQDGRLT